MILGTVLGIVIVGVCIRGLYLMEVDKTKARKEVGK